VTITKLQPTAQTLFLYLFIYDGCSKCFQLIQSYELKNKMAFVVDGLFNKMQ